MYVQRAKLILATTKNNFSENIDNNNRIVEIYEIFRSKGSKCSLSSEEVKSFTIEALKLKGLSQGGIDLLCDDSSDVRKTSMLQLFCFPYAGGNVDFYKKWKNVSTHGFDIELIEYPGRGRKIREPFAKDFSRMVDILCEEVEEKINGEFSFFGHSLGAIVAYEVAKKLKREKGMVPVCVFLSGCPAPHCITDKYSMNDLSDDEFISKVVSLGGIPKELCDQPDLLKSFLPTLRHDFAILDTYSPLNEDISSVPIITFAGDCDSKVSASQVKEWKGYTNSLFDCYVLKGNHFFIYDELPTIIDKVGNCLDELCEL